MHAWKIILQVKTIFREISVHRFALNSIKSQLHAVQLRLSNSLGHIVQFFGFGRLG